MKTKMVSEIDFITAYNEYNSLNPIFTIQDLEMSRFDKRYIIPFDNIKHLSELKSLFKLFKFNYNSMNEIINSVHSILYSMEMIEDLLDINNPDDLNKLLNNGTIIKFCFHVKCNEVGEVIADFKINIFDVDWPIGFIFKNSSTINRYLTTGSFHLYHESIYGFKFLIERCLYDSIISLKKLNIDMESICGKNREDIQATIKMKNIIDY